MVSAGTHGFPWSLPPRPTCLPAENTSLTVALRKGQMIGSLGLNYCTRIWGKAWLRCLCSESDPLWIACQAEQLCTPSATVLGTPRSLPAQVWHAVLSAAGPLEVRDLPGTTTANSLCSRADSTQNHILKLS